MSRNNTIEVTVRGRVAADPTFHTAPSGVKFTTFRLASTPRTFARESGKWIDGRTEWIRVTVFGMPFAENTAESLHKGQPVVVTGILSTSEWTDEKGAIRMGLALRAQTVGHDLFWGRANFYKTVEAATTPDLAPDQPEGPMDDAVPAQDGEAEATHEVPGVASGAAVNVEASGWEGLSAAA
ncbi:MAG: single-stranded DNA-binding protein [Bifidobacteriaceae bacterium]|jgi:single-strand DNA-binding protein|nr:single-stranded DNA-binding protein [Bifidobacteriaceae bacterium]